MIGAWRSYQLSYLTPLLRNVCVNRKKGTRFLSVPHKVTAGHDGISSSVKKRDEPTRKLLLLLNRNEAWGTLSFCQFTAANMPYLLAASNIIDIFPCVDHRFPSNCGGRDTEPRHSQITSSFGGRVTCRQRTVASDCSSLDNDRRTRS